MNEITLDIGGNPDLEPLADKKAGHSCDLTVTVKVTSNDGKTLKGQVTDVELGDDYNTGTEENAAQPADESDEAATAKKALSME